MKKFIALLCVLTCLLGLTACGEKPAPDQMTQTKISQCQQLADTMKSILTEYLDKDTASMYTSNYAKHELAVVYQQTFQTEADLGVFEGVLTTYYQSMDQMGGLVAVGESTYSYTDDEITITYELIGNKCNGTLTLTYTNDMFTKLVGGETVAKTSIKQKFEEAGTHMGDAGLNTVLGMGTVFSVLILISAIIASFNLFSKGKKDSKEKEASAVKASETVADTAEELSDDTELVAVIMAAISAYEGNSSSDGFVVRSIRRANRRN